MPKFTPLKIGIRFGRLVVESFSEFRPIGKTNHMKAYYNCICDCGTNIKVNKGSLLSGNTKSCGCFHRENLALLNKNKKGSISPCRKKDGEASFNHLYANYRLGAQRKGRVFELSKEEFKQITSSNCYYCNSPPIQMSKYNYTKTQQTGWYFYNGIDRIDNTVGYVLENARPCCGKCNKIKGTLTESDFYDIVKNIYEFRLTKKDQVK